MFAGILSWLFKCTPTAIVGYIIMLIRWKEIVKISPSYHIHVSSVSARYFYCICGMWPARVIFISLLWHIVFARVNRWSKELQNKKKNKQEKTAIGFCVKTFDLLPLHYPLPLILSSSGLWVWKRFAVCVAGFFSQLMVT